jgi:hypothetical protein
MNKLKRYFRKAWMYFKFVFFKGDMPPAVKHLFIKWTAKRYGLKAFIETGTAYGDTVWAVRKSFKKIYTVELDKNLFCHSAVRFFIYRNIEMRSGDSPQELKKILKYIDEPCLFWLDAHWSGGVTARGKVDTPVIDELKAIGKDVSNHVILIDDCMHLFEEIKKQSEKMGYNNIKVIRNIIRLTR